MKTLIVDDDFTSRFLLQEILNKYGTLHVAVNGKEAIDAVRAAMDSGEPYDLVCLDIMMPEVDGYQALEAIRELEESRRIPPSKGTKIFMITALDRVKNVSQAFRSLCDVFLVKPIEKGNLLAQLEAFKLV